MNTEPLITILTAMQATRARLALFPETARSVAELETPVRWEICLDGAGEKEAELVRTLLAQEDLDRRAAVRHLHGRSVGAAGCRNYALAHAETPYVSSLDDDDLLPPGTFRRRLALLEDDAELHWAGGWLRDLDAQGNPLTVWEHPLPPGPQRRGALVELWENPEDLFPMNTAGLLVRRDSLRGIGGWFGFPSAEDLAMVLRLSNAHEGYTLPEVIYGYRKHESQSLASEPFIAIEEVARRAAHELGILTRPA